MSNLRDIDQVPANLEPKLRGLLRSLREHVRSLTGLDGQGNRVILSESAVQEIVNEAVANLPGGGGGGGTPPVYVPDLTAPPTPAGVIVTAGLTNIFIETDNPTFSEGHGYARTIVYGQQWEAGQPDPTFSGAVKVHEFVGSVGSFTVRPGAKWSLWLKWLTEDGVESTAPSGGTNGHVAEAGKIGNADLGALIVEAGNLAAGAVTAAKFATSIEPVTIVTGASLPTVKSTNTIYWSGKLYRWSGTAYVATVPTTDLSGQVTNDQIAAMAAAKLTGQITSTQVTDGAISTPKLAAGAVMTDKIFAGAITAEKIAANTITANEIAANAITASELAADAVTAGKIQAGAITANKLAANAIAVGTAAVENGAISNAMIGNAAIDDAKIANLSAAKLTAGDGTIGGNLKSATYSAVLQQGWIIRPDGFAEFNDIVVRGTVFASQGAIGGSLIGANYIQSTNWVNMSTGWRLNSDGSFQLNGVGWINTAAIGDAQITAAKIADAAITAAKIADAQITTAKIQDAAVGTLQIAEESVFLSVYSFVPRQDVYDETCRTADYEVQIASATIGGLSGPGTGIVLFNTRKAVTDARTLTNCDSPGSSNVNGFETEDIMAYALSSFGPARFLHLDVRVNGVTRFTIASPYNGQTSVNSARFTRFACSVPLVAGTNNVTVHLRMSQSTYAQRMKIRYFVPPSDMIVFSGKR